jgi:predicted Zn-dependent protease
MKRASLHLLLVLIAVGLACTTSPLGRRQLKLVSSDEMDAMGIAAFDQLLTEQRLSADESANRYVRCVALSITDALDGEDARYAWEVRVFEDPSANAFALPGGRIGVHTGLLQVAQNQDQLATVLGHEVSHVLAGHANERVSTQQLTAVGLSLAQVAADPTNPLHGQLLGALGVGAQVGILLPYSRTHESEADLHGLDLMARAGFDPRESVALWQNMAAAAGGERPPEFLSTHPSPQTRIEELEERIPAALVLRERAREAGRRPSCG